MGKKDLINVDNTKQSPAILSLCTGLLRGLERGIEHALQTELRTIAYVEIETFVVDNLLQGMEKGILGPAPIWTNLKTFPYRQFHGKVFGITGGYPCQPFSVAGNRGGAKDPRHLWPFIRRITESTKPVFCFFENVEGHLNLGFEEVSRDLRKMGYRVEAGIYSAEEVGAPHQRKRLFILAIRNGGLEPIKRLLANSDSCSSSESIRRSTGEEKSIQGVHRQKNSTSGDFIGTNISDRKGIESQRYDEMVNTDNGGSSREKAIDRREEHVQERTDIRDSIIPTGEELADSRLQRSEIDEEQATRIEQRVKNHIPINSIIQQRNERGDFPSRPGEIQFDWEHPRVAKSGLGITIDGYNFREDLLRGAGNGVVWQTAALAFSDLLSKF